MCFFFGWKIDFGLFKGEYAERLSKKKFSNYLSESLNLITQAIHKESLQASATKTLSTICRNCDELLGEFYPTLYGIFSPFLLNTNVRLFFHFLKRDF